MDRESFAPGIEYAHVFDTPGVYPYYCLIHGTTEAGMIGTIIVTEPTWSDRPHRINHGPSETAAGEFRNGCQSIGDHGAEWELRGTLAP